LQIMSAPDEDAVNSGMDDDLAEDAEAAEMAEDEAVEPADDGLETRDGNQTINVDHAPPPGGGEGDDVVGDEGEGHDVDEDGDVQADQAQEDNREDEHAETTENDPKVHDNVRC
jgi:hypothetical protein